MSMDDRYTEILNLLENLPPSGEMRDHGLIAAIIALMNTTENAYGLLVSLCITCMHLQTDRADAMIRFLNIVSASFLNYEDELKKVMEDAKNEVKH